MVAASLRGMAEEVERRDRTGRVVRIVQPQDGRPGPGRLVDGIEIREEAVGLEQRQPTDVATDVACASFGIVYPGAVTSTTSFPASGSSVACASENTISFDPSNGSTWVSGSTSAPNRRPIQPDTASRSSGRPAARG